MTTATRFTTADDLFQITDDRFRYELVKGILKKISPAGKKHGKIAMRIAGPLQLFVQVNRLGEVYAAETGFKIAINPDTVRAPDASFMSKERAEQNGAAGC